MFVLFSYIFVLTFSPDNVNTKISCTPVARNFYILSGNSLLARNAFAASPSIG